MDFPLFEILDLIEDQVERGARGVPEALAEHFHEAGERNVRVNRGFQRHEEDLVAGNAAFQQAVDRLVENNRFPHTPRPQQHDRPADAAVGGQFVERDEVFALGQFPEWDRRRVGAPPWVVEEQAGFNVGLGNRKHDQIESARDL